LVVLGKNEWKGDFCPLPRADMKRERQIYKPSDLTQALAVFRDVHELLERHGRAWYPKDLHERAKRALLLLADKIAGTEFPEPPDPGSNVKDETPKTQERGRRAGLHIACQQLFLAVRAAMRSEEPLPLRLMACFLELQTLDFQRGLPTDLQRRFDTLKTALTRDPDPTGREWAAVTTIQKMNNEEASKWLDEVLNLFVEASARR
jgi:hypothetical protein